MHAPPLMASVWHWSERGVRSPAVVLEVPRSGQCTLCVYPVAGTAPYIVRDVPYMREVLVTTQYVRYGTNLHAVECWQYMSESDEQEDRMARETSYENGQAMAQALRALFGAQTSADGNGPAAVFALGRRFAVMAGYQDMESGFQYIEGFVRGFGEVAPKQLSAPGKESSGE